MRGKKLIVGFLVLLITSSIIYIALQGEGVKLRVDKDKTTLYVFEDSRWKIGGREYNKLFDGTRRLYRDVSNVKIYTHINETTNTTTIIRETPYKRGPFIRDTYYFKGDVKDKKLFPIYHKVEVYNASGLFYRYEVRDLVYSGPTYKLNGSTHLRFGRNVDVTLNPGYRWARVYKSGIVKAQYDVKSDYEVFYVKLFDPDSTTTTLYLDGVSADRYYEHGTIAVLKANVTNSTGDLVNSTICLDIDQVGYGDNYVCDNGTVEYNLTANAILGEFNDSTTAKNLTYTNAPENQTFYIRLNKYDEVQSAYINITGFQNPDWPLNIKIYVNDILVDSVIGYLGYGNQTLNEWSNGNAAENLSFSGEGTKKRYLRLPKNANVTSAYLDVSGYLGYTYWYDAETSWSYTGGWSSTHPASKCVDENWGSFGETVGGYVYENFSLSLENIHYINWYAHLATSTYSSYQTTNISLWNYSSNSWSLIYNFTHNETGYAYVHVYPNITIHNSVFINNTTPLQVKTFVTTYYYEGKVRFEQNPYNTYIGVGSGKVWNWSGEFTTDNGTQTVNLNATLINDYLSTCSADSEGYCNVPILFYSGSAGILEVSNIEVNYTYIVEPTRNINATAIQNYLDAQSSSGYYNIPVKISSETNSTIQVSNINITYYGSDNITVTAHFDGNADYSASNDTHVVKVVYSRFNTSIPVNYGYLEFIPNTPTDKNVSCYGQLETKPAINISWLNYDQPANLSMKINETHPCINITVSTTYNKSAGYVLNTSYIQLDSNKNLTDNTYLYLWADYACNYTDPYWRWWLPEFLLKAVCTNCVKGD